MKRELLRFTAVDVEMIHDGFVARAAGGAKGAVVAAVAP